VLWLIVVVSVVVVVLLLALLLLLLLLLVVQGGRVVRDDAVRLCRRAAAGRGEGLAPLGRLFLTERGRVLLILATR
jgi:hypothetical protein